MLADKQVFVVDSEGIEASKLGKIMRARGFVASTFTDPGDALSAAAAVTPDLLITDLALTPINGIDLGAQIKAMHPDCRVVLFSGHWAAVLVQDLARLAGHDFELLHKPMRPKAFLDALGKLMCSADGPSIADAPPCPCATRA